MLPEQILFNFLALFPTLLRRLPASPNFCRLLSHQLIFLSSLYCKQYGPRSEQSDKGS